MTGAHPRITAAAAGMDPRDRAASAAEIQARSRPDAPDDDGLGPVFESRAWEALEQAVIGKTTILLLHSYSALDVR